MEYAQLESRISFLDNEYRREKADLAQLRQQLDLSVNEREELVKRIESLEAELLAFKSESQRIYILESKMERIKNELLTAIDNHQNKQRQSLRDANQSQRIEMDSHTKALNEMRRDIDRGRNLDEAIALARAETERQSAIQIAFQQHLDELARQTDDQLRSITYLEEQRRGDNKRVVELQSETTDLFKRTNMQLSKIELLEQQIPQFGQFQIALEQQREIIRNEVERSQHQSTAVDRQVKRWEDLSETLLRRFDEYEIRLERYAEHYQINRKSLETLQAFQEQLSREQREFIELQRLAFDRQQNKLQEQETVQEKKIRDQTIDVQKQVNEAVKVAKSLQKEIDTTVYQLEEHQRMLTLLLRIAEEDVITRANTAMEWRARFEQLATDE